MLASMASSSLIPQAENSRMTREATMETAIRSETLRQNYKTKNQCCFLGFADLNSVGFEEISLQSLSVG